MVKIKAVNLQVKWYSPPSVDLVVMMIEEQLPISSRSSNPHMHITLLYSDQTTPPNLTLVNRSNSSSCLTRARLI